MIFFLLSMCSIFNTQWFIHFVEINIGVLHLHNVGIKNNNNELIC